MIRNAVMVALAFALAGCALPKDRPIAITLRVADLTATTSPATLDEAAGVLGRRLELIKADAEVERAGDQAIIVRLPGDADLDAVREVLLPAGRLEFIDPRGELLAKDTLVCTSGGARPAGAACEEPYPAVVDGAQLDLERVAITKDMAGQTALGFAFSEPAATRLGDWTAANVGRPLSIVLDGQVISTPVVQDRLPGEGMITFGAAADQERDAHRLLALLKGGALPAALEIERIEGQP